MKKFEEITHFQPIALETADGKIIRGLFSDFRIGRATLTNGLHCYELRLRESTATLYAVTQSSHEDDLYSFVTDKKVSFNHNSRGFSDYDFCAEKELWAFVWNYNHMDRNAADEEILSAWESGPSRGSDEEEDEEYEVEKLTPDEFAAYCNDGFFNESNQHVRFIEA